MEDEDEEEFEVEEEEEEGVHEGAEEVVAEEEAEEEVEEGAEEEVEDGGRGGKTVLESKSCVVLEGCVEVDDDDVCDEVDGGFGLISCCERDACHRLSRKFCVKVFMVSGFRLALALIKATCINEEKQFRMFSISQKMVLGKVTGAVVFWLAEGLETGLV